MLPRENVLYVEERLVTKETKENTAMLGNNYVRAFMFNENVRIINILKGYEWFSSNTQTMNNTGD